MNVLNCLQSCVILSVDGDLVLSMYLPNETELRLELSKRQAVTARSASDVS